MRINKSCFMVGVAQLVRAPGCGPGGRGFETHHSPHFTFKRTVEFRLFGLFEDKVEA